MQELKKKIEEPKVVGLTEVEMRLASGGSVATDRNISEYAIGSQSPSLTDDGPVSYYQYKLFQ